jgi:hypothetical protein
VADYYYSVVAHAVSGLPRKNDEVRHAIYEHTRTALQERLHNDPQISDAQLVNEQFALEAAISSSLLKNPRHGESVVIQFSVTNRRRLACAAHL